MDLKHQKWMKCGIGFLTAIMMLGTALFSVQAFTGKFQQDIYTAAVSNLSSHNNISTSPVDTISGSVSGSGSGSSDTTKPGSEAASSPHTMDSSPETKGFLAVPWIPVSFIRQSMSRDISLEELIKLIRTYKIISYPEDKMLSITGRNIRSMSNIGYQLQALSMRIARLTAG